MIKLTDLEIYCEDALGGWAAVPTEGDSAGD